MPPYDRHLETSKARTGNAYQAMHDWLDNNPDMKASRHSLDKLPENISFVRSSWGDEAVSEYLLHVVEDVAMPDIEALRRVGCPAKAVAHSIEVARKALEMSSRVRVPVDRKLVIRGAVYHDLGKAKTHGMEHGEVGLHMANELQLGDDIKQIIVKHVRGGLTEPEAVELGLPVRDYTLKTLEEKLVVYSDRLVDIYTDGVVPNTNEQDAESRFVEILQVYVKYGKNPMTLGRYAAMHREIHQEMAVDARRLIIAYHNAWTTGDFAAARRCLSDTLDFKGSIDTFQSADDFIKALTAFKSMLRGTVLLRSYFDQEGGALLYDCDTATPAGVIRTAEFFTVVGERIAEIRLVFDATELRKLMGPQ